jgi:hypothetical protein
MPIRFVCLANSYKLYGRCIAGILLDKKNNPVLAHDSPKWIRPIGNTEHGEIPTNLVSHVRLLDIIEIEDIVYVGDGHQSENATFDANSIELIGTYPKEALNILCEDERPLIFGNKRKAVHRDYIYRLHYSLMLVRADGFEVIEAPSENNPERTQNRLIFQYKNEEYDLPITDPAFLENYRHNNNGIADIEQIFITLSLGLNLNDFYHKLVAGIIY